MNCPECIKPMRNLGNISHTIMTSNPVQWDDTWICEDCKVKVNERKYGSIIPPVPDLSKYRTLKIKEKTK